MINHAVFFDAIRWSPFKGLDESQVRGIESLLAAAPMDFRTDYLAYCLATTYHETGHTMLPIEEYGKGRGRAYGVPTGPWHMVYDGRGDVQLTWLDNYVKATKRLRELGVLKPDEDLAKTPDLAMRPDVAAAIMFYGMVEGWFTGRKLGDYFGTNKCDPLHARQIINAMDRAQLIAGYFQAFYAALVKAAVISDAPVITVNTTIPVGPTVQPPSPAPVPPVIVVPAPAPTPAPAPVASQSWWVRFINALLHRS